MNAQVNKEQVMGNVLIKTINSVRTAGILSTAARILAYVGSRANHRRQVQRRQAILSAEQIEDRFTQIYHYQYWGNGESVSGPGSTLGYTVNIRRQLLVIFDRFEIRSVFDAPCGDFNWMALVLEKANVSYVGGDIVAPLVQALNGKYSGPSVRFLHTDITKDRFPDADLWICRDCLFHLCDDDIKKALECFVESQVRYLLTTTHINQGAAFSNSDILSGDFRRIDLFAAPYNLPRDVLFRCEDWQAPEPPREMCLWTRAQVQTALTCWRV